MRLHKTNPQRRKVAQAAGAVITWERTTAPVPG